MTIRLDHPADLIAQLTKADPAVLAETAQSDLRQMEAELSYWLGQIALVLEARALPVAMGTSRMQPPQRELTEDPRDMTELLQDGDPRHLTEMRDEAIIQCDADLRFWLLLVEHALAQRHLGPARDHHQLPLL